MVSIKYLKSRLISLKVNPDSIDLKSMQKSYGRMKEMSDRHIKQNWKALVRLGKEA
jgi:hypothetical protein